MSVQVHLRRAFNGVMFGLVAAYALLVAARPSEAADPTPVPTTGPFAEVVGYWAGDGRLAFKDGKLEQVKCRATYIVAGDVNALKQTIRCASAGGKVEVVADVANDNGKLAGQWVETVYNTHGDISGELTARGFRVQIKGQELALSANMDIIVHETKQIIEIQFFSETLLGLTLVLNKG